MSAHLDGKIGGYVGAAQRCDRLADQAEAAGNAEKATALRLRAQNHRARAEQYRQIRGAPQGHWRLRLKALTGLTYEAGEAISPEESRRIRQRSAEQRRCPACGRSGALRVRGDNRRCRWGDCRYED
jgi:hypothetical protein